MCTILTVSQDLYNKNRDVIVRQILADHRMNDDGYSLLMYASRTEQFTQLRGFDVDALLASISSAKWDRIWIHQRMATQGSVSLDNCHGWSADGTYIMHNGIIFGAEAKKLAVDSMIISRWVSEEGWDEASMKLLLESFANVFLIDANGYRVHASHSGQLYTDQLGNYSTNEIEGLIEGRCSGADYRDHHMDGGLVYDEKPFPVSMYYSTLRDRTFVKNQMKAWGYPDGRDSASSYSDTDWRNELKSWDSVLTDEEEEAAESVGNTSICSGDGGSADDELPIELWSEADLDDFYNRPRELDDLTIAEFREFKRAANLM